MHPAHRAAHRPGTLTPLRLVSAWTEGARGHNVTREGYGAAGSMGHAAGISVARRSPKEGPSTITDECSRPVTAPSQLLVHRGRYHTDRQPGAALQNTVLCPAGRSPHHLHTFSIAPPHARVDVWVTRARARRGDLRHVLAMACWCAPSDAHIRANVARQRPLG
jgi:hypothetical protein